MLSNAASTTSCCLNNKLLPLTDIYRDKVLWTGDTWHDWHLFVGLHHPFYSVFKSPTNHEFSRKERIVVLLCMVAISSIVASLSTFVKKIMDDEWIGTGISVLGGIFITVTSKCMVCSAFVFVKMIF